MLSRLVLLLITCITIAGNPLWGQNFEGIWFGNLTQELDPPFDKYTIQLNLTQEGDVVNGTTLIYLADSSHIFAEMSLKGVVKEKRLFFTEKELLRSYHFSDWDWCLKRGLLRIVEGQENTFIAGAWQGFVGRIKCVPGKIAVERADTILVDPLPPKAIPEPIVEVKEPVIVKAEPVQQDIFEGRTISQERFVTVKDRELTVFVWDANKEDGDIVSLHFNGEWLLKDHLLQNKKFAVQLEIQSGEENRLVLFAENLGSIPPNTCALTFFDGEKERNLNLKSDEGTCGSLRFDVKD